jgi:putative nucleotidyltransferase with HDIG domain
MAEVTPKKPYIRVVCSDPLITRYASEPMTTAITLVAEDDLIAVSVFTIAPDAPVCVDLFIRSAADSRIVLFCTKGATISGDRLTSLTAEGVSKLYINRESYEAYQSYLRENWLSLIEDGNHTNISRAKVMSEVVRAVLNEQLTNNDTEALIEACDGLGESITNILCNHPVLVSELCNVIHHDYATFTHSTNVAIYAVLLANEVGYSQLEVKQIAVGALLHDLGKMEIPERILTKPGRLDEFEFREIKKHPTLGFQRLVEEQQQLRFPQLMMVYQHHEKLNGEGYPVGVAGAEIHPWARLCAVVDIFEALTSQRPYRKPMSVSTALAVLNNASGTELDEELVKCWRALVQKKA